MFGIFGDLFDFNHNGKLEPTEQAMEFALLQTIIDEDAKKDDTLTLEDIDDFDLLDDE